MFNFEDRFNFSILNVVFCFENDILYLNLLSFYNCIGFSLGLFHFYIHYGMWHNCHLLYFNSSFHSFPFQFFYLNSSAAAVALLRALPASFAADLFSSFPGTPN